MSCFYFYAGRFSLMKKYKSVKDFALPLSVILGTGLYSFPGMADPCTSVTDGDGKRHLTCT